MIFGQSVISLYRVAYLQFVDVNSSAIFCVEWMIGSNKKTSSVAEFNTRPIIHVGIFDNGLDTDKFSHTQQIAESELAEGMKTLEAKSVDYSAITDTLTAFEKM